MSQKTFQLVIPFDDLALHRWENEGGRSPEGPQRPFADDTGASVSWGHSPKQRRASRDASRKACRETSRTKRGAQAVAAFGRRSAAAGA